MFFNVQDAIRGQQAKAYANIDGRIEELFYGRTLEATIEKKKTDVPILGKTTTPQRAAGWTGSGTLNVYYVTSVFRNLMLRYVKANRDFYFDLTVVNEDPESSVGKQTVVLKNCNLTSITIAKFDATSDEMLNEDLPFTFDDVDILDQFGKPIGI
ncbi:phage tail tube protein [Brevibacillus borstelensis]|uniref:phage tail tube protein n=1 Tax=Brevibacillus borstelensis TaxID=45462 RepID=UPI0030C3CF3C